MTATLPNGTKVSNLMVNGVHERLSIMARTMPVIIRELVKKINNDRHPLDSGHEVVLTGMGLLTADSRFGTVPDEIKGIVSAMVVTNGNDITITKENIH